MNAQLEQIYRAYLDTLNERRLGDLGQYLQGHVVYNGKTITWQQYAQMIADDIHNIPDLRFVIDLCVFSDDTVACRLWFDCTPVHEFAGITPTGRRVTFAEHVFYRFRDGRIDQVRSLIDTSAAREQMT